MLMLEKRKKKVTVIHSGSASELTRSGGGRDELNETQRKQNKGDNKEAKLIN